MFEAIFLSDLVLVSSVEIEYSVLFGAVRVVRIANLLRLIGTHYRPQEVL